jgi:hypothetical protein
VHYILGEIWLYSQQPVLVAKIRDASWPIMRNANINFGICNAKTSLLEGL